MPDLKLDISTSDATVDLSLAGADLAVDSGLNTAVVISLLTDRRALADDPLPDDGQDRRGWWGDAFPEVEGDLIGSRRWLLTREKQLPQVLRLEEQYAREALQWLIDDGIAGKVEVVGTDPRQSVVALQITITKPDGSQIDIRFANLWEAMRAL